MNFIEFISFLINEILLRVNYESFQEVFVNKKLPIKMIYTLRPHFQEIYMFLKNVKVKVVLSVVEPKYFNICCYFLSFLVVKSSKINIGWEILFDDEIQKNICGLLFDHIAEIFQAHGYLSKSSSSCLFYIKMTRSVSRSVFKLK